MRKGITPVVAIILLLVIVIVVVGFAFTFFSDIVTTAGETAEGQVDNTVNQLGQSFRIDGASAGTGIVYIRNTGTSTINVTKLAFYVDGIIVYPDPLAGNPATIPEGQIAGITLDLTGVTVTTNSKLKVSGGAAQQTVNFPSTTPPTTGLSITSNPSPANYDFNNGQLTGATPSGTLSGLTPGTYPLLVTLAGYNDYSTNVNIVANQITNVNAVFVGSIFVDSVPQGADIYLDNNPIGQITPYTITNLNPINNPYEIRLTLAGYDDYIDSNVNVVAGQTVTVNPTLTLSGGGLGDITITSEPTGANYNFNNGQYTGSTPQILTGIPAGSYTLNLTMPEWRSDFSTVNIVSGAQSKHVVMHKDYILFCSFDGTFNCENATGGTETPVDNSNVNFQPGWNINVTPLTANTAIQFHFDEAGGTIAYDSDSAWGGMNNGTVYAGYTNNSVIGTAISFNKTIGSNVSIIWNSGALQANSFSLEMWIRMTPASDIQTIVSRGSGASYPMFAYIDNGIPKLSINRPPLNTVMGTSRIDDNIWHYIVFTRDNTAQEMKVYVDGQLQGTQPDVGSVPFSNVNMTLGARANGVQLFNGTMDEFAYYAGFVLPPAAILNQYNSIARGVRLHTDDAIPTHLRYWTASTFPKIIEDALTNNYTIHFRMRHEEFPTATGPRALIEFNRTTSTRIYYGFPLSIVSQRGSGSGETVNFGASSIIFPRFSWNNITVTVNSTNMSIYRNNVFNTSVIGTVGGVFPPNTGTSDGLYIASPSDLSGSVNKKINVTIDQLYIYDHVRVPSP